MSMILDLIIISAAAVCIIIHWHGGFVRALLSLGGFFASLVCGIAFAGLLAVYIEPYISGFFENYSGSTLASVIKSFNLSAHAAATVLSFGIIYISVSFIMIIVKQICKVVFKLPVLKQADRFLGFILGVILAVLIVNVLSILMFTFSDVLIRAFDFIGAEMFRGSFVAKWIYEHNVFGFIMRL